MVNIDELIEKIYGVVNSHKLSAGEYVRYLWQNEQNSRKLGVNEYGCADAANILYTINKFPRDIDERAAFVNTLQKMQNPQTGLYEEGSHHTIHTTAHCIAALELFDAAPLYPLTELMQYAKPENLIKLLENLDWKDHCWPQSHQGAGIYAAMKLTDSVDKQWERTYFKWFWDNTDSETGMWTHGQMGKGQALPYTYMGAAFHYLFNHEYARMPLRYPDKMIDFCLELYKKQNVREQFGRIIGFIEVDWIFCITRALRRSGHRREECIDCLRTFADDYITWLNSLDFDTHDGANDLHALFGATCALAELQSALPGEVETDKPLRIVLDRRPFI